MRWLGQQFFLRCFSLIIFALLAVPGIANADRTITSVELDGNGTGILPVVSSAAIEAEVFVTTDGNGANGRWRSTSWTIDGVQDCYDHTPNHDSEGSYSETFNFVAPAASGIYNVDFIAYRRDDCSQGASNTVTRQVEVTSSFPSVDAMSLASPDPTTANMSVEWIVDFSAAVTGVDQTDFDLIEAGGATGSGITAVIGSGTSWTVTIDTGDSGTGTLGLNLVDNDSIVDVSSVPLGGAGNENGDFTGSIYTLAPSVTSITLASSDPTSSNSSVSWTVNFNTAVTGVDQTDFDLIEAGGATGSSIMAVTGSGTSWTVTADTGASNAGSLGLNLVDDDTIINLSSTSLGGAADGSYVGPSYTLFAPACPDDSSYPLLFTDDFSDGDRDGWDPLEFNYSISNYPGETVADVGQTSNAEWQTDWTVNSGELWWNRGGSAGSADEYGMLSYDLSTTYNTAAITEYSIKADINGYPDDQNNDVGIVFGYVDDSNYYVVRWTKYGEYYASSASGYPGTYRRMTLARVSAGTAEILAYRDSLYDAAEFELKVTVRPDGIYVCVDGNAYFTYTGAEYPALNLFGLYTFDNDDGVSFDNVEIRAILNSPTLSDCISGVVTNGLPKMEVAAFQVINTYDLQVPTTVNFTQSFDTPPLVFTLPTTDGGDTAAHRIRNVTSSGFQIMTVEPEGEDGPHIAMGLNFLAIEPGVYILPDGHRLEACSFETTKSQQTGENDEWEMLTFLSDFSQTAAMLGQVQTMNNEAGNIPEDHSTPWLTTAISSVSSTGAKIALERSEAVTGEINGTERIAYLASEPTDGRQSFDIYSKTIDYEILRSDAEVLGWGDCQNIYYSSPWTDVDGSLFRPIPLASMNTRGGDDEAGEDDGGWFRRCPENSVNNESARLQLSVDEIRKGSSNTDGNRSKTVGERAGIFVFSDNFVTNPVSLDHFRFVHPVTGVTCLPSTVELYACEDSDCTTLYTGNVTVNLGPSDSDSHWSGPSLIANQIEFSNGFVELQLRHFQQEKVTLNANGTPVPTNELVCMSGGTVSDCGITFSDAGFTIDVPDLVANKPDGPVTIRAVKSDPTDATACTPAFTGTRTVSLWSSYEDPDTGTMSVSLEGTTIASDSSGTEFDLVFDANAEASISEIHYADAGQLGLNARFEGSGEEAGLVMTGAGLFVSRPVGLAVLTTDADADCLSGDHNCSVFQRSGEAFNLTVRGVAWTHDGDTNLNDNSVTPNYQHADIALGHNLAAPLLGNLGTLGETSVNITTSGESTFSQTVSEVGVFSFTALPTENSYFGLTVPGGESASIGRFIPDRFAVSSNTPLFASSCAASFTYLGQPFDYIVVPQLTVTALNTSGNATLNYGGDFWMLGSSLSGRSHVDNSGSGLTLTMNDSGTVSWSGTSDYDGTGQASISGMSLVYSKPATARVPFNSDVDLTFAATDLTDSDGVCLDSDSDGACDSHRIANIGNTEQRFGRLRLQNAYGSELLNLVMPLQIEYFSVGGFFTANSQDGCTSLTTADHLQNSVDAANWTAGDTSVPVGSGTTSSSFSLMPFISGAAELVFTAPGANNVGTVYIRSSLLSEFPWLLQDKDGDGNLDEENAKVTFGIFKGNQRLIYMRESIW